MNFELQQARRCFEREDWRGVIAHARAGLGKGEDGQAYDLMAAAWYYLGDYPRALAAGEEALKKDPFDGRLRENLRHIRAKLARQN